MKTVLIIAAIVLSISGAYALNIYQQSNIQKQQLTEYERHVQQMLSQVEENSRQRLQYDKQIGELKSELTMLSSQLTSVLNQLQIAQSQADPDYQELETKIRRSITNEFQAEVRSSAANSRLNLVKQMVSLDSVELGEIMSIQSQFGGFLGSLDVSDERLEIIVDALGNLIADQNQSRMNLMMEARSQDINPREMRSQMRAINSPQVQLETLSFVLTDDELSTFENFQTTQAEQRVAARSLSTNPNAATDGSVFRFGGRSQGGRVGGQPGFFINSGNGTAEAIQIIPPNPPRNR